LFSLPFLSWSVFSVRLQGQKRKAILARTDIPENIVSLLQIRHRVFCLWPTLWIEPALAAAFSYPAA
jgi:hypothetical protein